MGSREGLLEGVELEVELEAEGAGDVEAAARLRH